MKLVKGNYIRRRKVFDIDEILSKVPTLKEVRSYNAYIILDGLEIKVSNSRLRLFKEKGVSCVNCGATGKFFALECHTDQLFYPINGGFHLNLYGLNQNGHEVLMTKDHIKPKAFGGTNHPENLQPMCSPCNHRKGAYYKKQPQKEAA